MKAATLSRSTNRIPQPALNPLEGMTKTTTRKTAVLVGLCFLMATFTFAIGSAQPVFAPALRSASEEAVISAGLDVERVLPSSSVPRAPLDRIPS